MYLVNRIGVLGLKTVQVTNGGSKWDNETRLKESIKFPVDIYF